MFRTFLIIKGIQIPFKNGLSFLFVLIQWLLCSVCVSPKLKVSDSILYYFLIFFCIS